jgi:hypothetical protein
MVLMLMATGLVASPKVPLGYHFLTPETIINVEYAGNTDNYKKYLPEFENSIKTIKILNPIFSNIYLPSFSNFHELTKK